MALIPYGGFWSLGLHDTIGSDREEIGKLLDKVDKEHTVENMTELRRKLGDIFYKYQVK